MLRAARHIPTDGVLLTDERLAGYLGNRPSLITFKSIRTNPHDPDYVLFNMSVLNPGRSGSLRPLMRDGSMGVIAFEPPFVVMQRGADPARNAEILAATNHGPVQDKASE